MSVRGSTSHRIEVRNKITGKTKVKLGSKILKEQSDEGAPEGSPVGHVRVGSGLTLSRGFNAVRVDVAVDIPWRMRPNNSADVRAGIRFASKIADNALARRAEEIDKFLDELAQEK